MYKITKPSSSESGLRPGSLGPKSTHSFTRLRVFSGWYSVSYMPQLQSYLPYSPNMYFIPLQPTWSQTHLQCLTFTSAPPTGYFLLYTHNFQILSSVSKKFSLIFLSCDNLSSELLHLHSPSTAIGFLRLRDKKLQLFISSTQYQTSSTWAFSLYLSNELKMPLLPKNEQCL